MKDIAQAGQRFRQNKTALSFTIETNALHMGTEKSLEEAITITDNSQSPYKVPVILKEHSRKDF
jgi:hypothetical protein